MSFKAIKENVVKKFSTSSRVEALVKETLIELIDEVEKSSKKSIKEGDKVSKLENDAGYLTKSPE